MKVLLLVGDSLLGRINTKIVDSIEEALPEYEVINSAWGGMKSSDLRRKAPLLARYKADVMLVSIGTNDAYDKVPLKDFSQNLHQAFMELIHTQASILLLPPPPVDIVRHGEGVKYNNHLRVYYDAALREAAKFSSVHVLDVWERLLKLMEEGEDYHEKDGVHFNEKGYEELVPEISRSIVA